MEISLLKEQKRGKIFTMVAPAIHKFTFCRLKLSGTKLSQETKTIGLCTTKEEKDKLHKERMHTKSFGMGKGIQDKLGNTAATAIFGLTSIEFMMGQNYT